MTRKGRRRKETNQVDWQVLYEEDPGPDRGELPGDKREPARDTGARWGNLLRWAGLLALFLLVAGYAIPKHYGCNAAQPAPASGPGSPQR